MNSGPPQPEELVDLLGLLRRSGWPALHITALANTCAAAAGKESMPADERAFAGAVAAALRGDAPGISRAHLARLAEAELSGLAIDPGKLG